MAPVDPRAITTLEAHVGYIRALTTAGGGTIVDRNGVFIYRSTSRLPFLVNGAARVDPDTSADGVVEAAMAFFGDRGFEVLCLVGRDDDLREATETAGLRVGSPDPLQFLDLAPNPGPADRSSLEVRIVVDADGVGDVATINQDATAAFGFPDGVFASIFANPATVLSPRIHAVVAYKSGTPVATAQIFMHDDVAYVGWVAVIQEAMRRGLGWMVTEEVVNEGFARGAKAAVLIASPMGAPLYTKMGFEDVGVLRNAYSQEDRAT